VVTVSQTMIKTIGSIVILVGLPTIPLALAVLAADSAEQPRSSISQLLNKNWSPDIQTSLAPTEADSATVQAATSSFAHGIAIGAGSISAASLATLKTFTVDQPRPSISELLNRNWSSNIQTTLAPTEADSAAIQATSSSFTHVATGSDAAAPLATLRAFSIDQTDQTQSSVSELLNNNWSSDIRSSVGHDGGAPNDIRAPNDAFSHSPGSFGREHN